MGRMRRISELLMKRAEKSEDWYVYYGIAWYLGLMSAYEANRKYLQKYIVVTLQGNYVRKPNEVTKIY